MTIIAPTTDELADALRPFARLSELGPDDRVMTIETWRSSYLAPAFRKELEKLTVGDLRRAHNLLARHDHFKREGFDTRNSKTWDNRDDSKPGREVIDA